MDKIFVDVIISPWTYIILVVIAVTLLIKLYKK